MANELKRWFVHILIFYILCIYLVHICSGHGVNENLFFEIVYPPDISYLYMIRPAKSFGGPFSVQGHHHIKLVPTDPLNGCHPLEGQSSLYMKGQVALTKRGGCSFLTKTINAQAAGAIAIFIYDSNGANDNMFIDMIEDGTERAADIPAAFLLGRDGHRITESLQSQSIPAAEIILPVNITGIPFGKLKTAPWTVW